MEKLDAYKTLTNWVSAFANNDEIATQTPFIFVIQTPDGEGCNFIGCNTTHNVKDLVQIILVQFVSSMKNAIKEGVDAKAVVGEMLSNMCKMAMIESFFKEILLENLSGEAENPFEESV